MIGGGVIGTTATTGTVTIATSTTVGSTTGVTIIAASTIGVSTTGASITGVSTTTGTTTGADAESTIKATPNWPSLRPGAGANSRRPAHHAHSPER
jgi:hypothetical protein